MSIQKNKYYYPIVLKNEHLNPFRITPNIEIRKIKQSEREEFFGLEDVDFTFKKSPIGYLGFNNFIKSNDNKGRYPYNTLFQRGLFDGSGDILASNYVIVVENDDSSDHIIKRLNLSFKLFKPTSSGGYLCFKEKETDVHFHISMPIHGPFDYLDLNQDGLDKIKKFFLLIEGQLDNDKFKLLADLFDRSLQGGNIPLDIRFLLLAIALESLYLPNQDTEAQLRLSLRVSKLLNKFGHGEAKEIFEKIKNVYKIRSKLVHSGKTKDLTNNMFFSLTYFVQQSLILYIESPDYFTEEALTNIML